MPSTKLDAVNAMLFVIGQSPVNSLVGLTGLDAIKAIAILEDIDRTVQKRGWDFNIEDAFPLQVPNIPPFELHVPSNVLEMRPSDRYRSLVVRGSRVYDTERHTYEFSSGSTIHFDIIWQLPFEDLPVAATDYIYTRAARVFANRSIGDEGTNGHTLREEEAARAELNRSHTRKSRVNMFFRNQPRF